ncbi:acetate--CoA ligase family protein [Rubrobacter aplysinae]|uniref:acetate--CoA ligase family protein n=1 Tax=Rubrobacter aplysinae TaxID=909625 RepID=UPI000B247154|nr:acetate--CoA ligase family protein [Rubrobacter aplysinae]
MTPRGNVQRLLAPRSIVFVGGRDLAGAIHNCEDLGYEGRILVVNPKYEELAGYPCYPSIAELPEAPDAAFVGIRREATIEAVGELAALGVGGCVCYAAGFAELGHEGEALQEELVAAAGEMALVGPNCYGMLNYLEGPALWPDLHGGERTERGVAVVSQSGNISLNVTMADRSLPLSHVISIGNQAVLGLADYVDALIEDPRVQAIGLYVEGIKDVGAFSRAALRAQERGVPVVALKSGSSSLGTRITRSHTSSLSDPDELYDALFERLGIVRAGTLAKFLETLKLLAYTGPLKGRKIGVLAGSGGDSAMFADLAAPLGLSLPELDDSQEAAFAEQLGDFVSISNPLDYNTAVWGDREKLQRCFTTMMRGEFDVTVLTLDYPRGGEWDVDAWNAAADALISSQKETCKVAAVACTIPELLPSDARQRLLDGGVVPLQGLPEATAALAGAAWYAERRREISDEDSAESLVPAAPGRAPRKPRLLDEWESKRLLAASGVRVPEARTSSAGEAAGVAAGIGYPVVVKPVAAELAHKSDHDAVALDLRDDSEVRTAVERVAAAGLSNGSNGEDGFLIERMVRGAVAELIIGLRRDERFGLALVVGSGGTLTELVRDSATVLLPAGRAEISRALDSLKVSALISGFRGGPAGDREAAVQAVLDISAFADERRDEIEELEVNPLLVLPRGEGAVAADALIRMQSE